MRTQLERLQLRNLYDEFENKIAREWYPVRKHGLKKIEICYKLRWAGYRIDETHLQRTIMLTLPPCWDIIKFDLLERHNTAYALDLLTELEKLEMDLHPLWIKFEKERMGDNTTVGNHVHEKTIIYQSLKNQGFSPTLINLVYAIVNSLPRWWPIKSLHKKLGKRFMDIRDLVFFLEEEEKKISSFWVEFVTKKMAPSSSLRAHVLKKIYMWKNLSEMGHNVTFDTFTKVIIDSLSEEWIISVSTLVEEIKPCHEEELLTLLDGFEEYKTRLQP